MDKPKDWVKFIHLAELWYNTSKYSSTGMTPFELVYGRSPPALFHCEENPLEDKEAHDVIKNREETMLLVKQNLSRAVEGMKKKADRRRSDVQFEVGDEVLVKLNKYRQNSVVARKSNKLERNFFGPYPITKKIGEVVVRLQLSVGAKIYNVFHSLLLKKFVPGDSVEVAMLPEDLVELEGNLVSEDAGIDTPNSIPRPLPKRQRRVPPDHGVYQVDYVGDRRATN